MQLQCDGRELRVAIVRVNDRTDWRSQSIGILFFSPLIFQRTLSLAITGKAQKPRSPKAGKMQFYRTNNELICNKSAGLSVPLACRKRRPPSNTL